MQYGASECGSGKRPEEFRNMRQKWGERVQWKWWFGLLNIANNSKVHKPPSTVVHRSTVNSVEGSLPKAGPA
jgi:hypothetical protein